MVRIGQTLLVMCLAAVLSASAAPDRADSAQALLIAHLGLAHPLAGQLLRANAVSPATTAECH